MQRVEDFDVRRAYPPDVLKWFLDHGVDPMTRNPKSGHSHLTVYFARDPIPQWRESVALLIERKADVNDLNNNYGVSLIGLASQYGSAELVRFLLNVGADARAKNTAGVTPLMFACSNRDACQELIPLLMLYLDSSDLNVLDRCGRNALVWASEWSSVAFRVMCLYYPNIKPRTEWTIMASCADPWRVILDGIACNFICLSETKIRHAGVYNHLRFWLDAQMNPPTISGDLPACSTPLSWKIMIGSQGEARMFGTNRNTFLHHAVKKDQLPEIRYIVQGKRINPYLVNKNGKRAIDLVDKQRDPVCYSLLWDYMKFQPTPRHMEWHGPYFKDKLFVFLLVLHRLGIPMPLEIVVMIFQRIAFLQDY